MKYITRFYPGFAKTIVYMLQASEYNLPDFWEWYRRVGDFRYNRVAKRRQLDMTRKAQLLLLAAWSVNIALGIIALSVIALAFISGEYWLLLVAVAIAVGGPSYMVLVLTMLLKTGYEVVQKPKEQQIIAASTQKLAGHKGFKIAIAGSYGKTSFKELLNTILAEGKKVAATPGNANTPLGISRFVNKLEGNEDILIFEMGEYYPGDITQLCEMVRPDLGVITGINQAHLSKFGSIKATVATIFELADFLGNKPVYKNGQDQLVLTRCQADDPLLYSAQGADGWKVSKVSTGITGTSFTATKGKLVVNAASKLLGLHNVGPLVGAIAIAEKLGLSPEQISAGIAATAPFEHRMQPRQLGGAWIIDDTYNGNIDGAKAGITFLAAAEAKRRIYVTPGLVELGDESDTLHKQLGEQLAGVADVVVLMQNSTTNSIKAGLEAGNFKGKLITTDDPVGFYNGLEHFVAGGDVVLLQNDWPDNYN